jgi:hypothetical protein
LNVSLDVDIETLIKVCSFEVHYSEDNGVTWKKAEYEKPPYDYASRNYYVIPYASKDFIKILNTGNVPLQYKVWKNGENYQTWENYDDWVDLNTDVFSNVLEYRYSTGEQLFLVNTLGVAFDNGGIGELVFRANSSIVISSFNSMSPYIGFYILEP